MNTLYSDIGNVPDGAPAADPSGAEMESRLPYASPKLTVHGRFQQITLGISPGGDTGDCPPNCDDE